jgi:hypothetical protein
MFGLGSTPTKKGIPQWMQRFISHKPSRGATHKMFPVVTPPKLIQLPFGPRTALPESP